MSKTANPNWLKIRVHCPESVLEPVSDLIGVLSGSGVELEPVTKGKSFVSGFFQLDQEHNKETIVSRLEQEISELFSLYNEPAPLLSCSSFKDEDWATSWQQFFKPFPIIPGLIIKPSWEPYQQKTSEQVIEMDPGMAFGTGKHASTQLALRLIHDCFQETHPQSVLDVGTGTGILAMATALFGADQIVAIDNDPEAVRVCVENIRHNSLEKKITASATDLASLEGHFDLLCANIVHNVLVMMLPDFSRLLVNGSRLILAGILLGNQEKNIIDLAKKKGLIVQRVIYEEEWAGLLFEKMHPL
jgi:ribosomal protein L11 methyltransferase